MTPQDDVWVEWGVRRTWGPLAGSVAFFERDRKTAEKCARDWPGELVQRAVVAHPWQDVPLHALSALAVAPNGGAVEVGATEALRGAQIEDCEEAP